MSGSGDIGSFPKLRSILPLVNSPTQELVPKEISLPVYIDALICRRPKLLKNRHIPQLEEVEVDRQRYAIERSLWLTKRWPHSYIE
jgi:hypothetical protein